MKSILKLISLLTAVILLYNGTTLCVARAEIIGAEAVLRAEHTEARELVTAYLARADVAAELEKYGVSSEEAALRVASFSEHEISRLAEEITQAPAGADGVGTVIGAVVFIFVLLLITDIIGFTKVFPFTRSIH